MKKRYNTRKICILLALTCTVHFVYMGFARSFKATIQDKARVTSAKSTPITWATIRSRGSTPIICDRSSHSYDWCYLNRPAVLNPKTATFSALRLHNQPHAPPHYLQRVRPYPRKWEPSIMSIIKEVTLTTSSLNQSCDVYHETPALVFSVGGYTGNLFHDFNDGIIPLYITLHTLFPPGQDVTLVISGFTNWWYSKYEAILPEFSRHPVINLDNQTAVHCFPFAAVGLISHGAMTIDPTLIPPTPKTLLDFRALLEHAYSKRYVPIKPPPLREGKPRLVLVGRKGTVGRVMLNQEAVIQAAEAAGFDVLVFQPTKFTYLVEAYALINASHAMLGVHGAALTHALFLRPGAVLVQVVPLGVDWPAEMYFGNMAAKGLGFEYVEYKIKVEESSLMDKYGKDHELVRHPEEIAGRNWTALDTVYLKRQDVKINMRRFKGYLRRAYLKAKRFMDKRG